MSIKGRNLRRYDELSINPQKIFTWKHKQSNKYLQSFPDKNTNTNSIHIVDKGVSLTGLKAYFRDFCWYKSLRIKLDRKFRGANFREWKIFRKNARNIYSKINFLCMNHIFGSHQCTKNVLYECLFYNSTKDQKYLQKSHKKP